MEKVYLSPADIREIGKGNIPSMEDFNEVWRHIAKSGFIFDGFWIICEHNNTKYQVVIDNSMDFLQVVKIKKVWYEDIAHHIDITMPIYVWRMKYIESMNNPNASIDPDFKESVLPMMFIQYVTYAMLHREIEIIEPETRNNSSTTSRSSKKNPRYSLTSCIKKYRHKNKNKKYEYHIESWTRRGGIRHYKSGKVGTFSGSTCRPKNKGTGTSDKEYRL